MNDVKLRAQLRGLARVLFVLALCVCAGALGLQAMTRAAIAAQAPSPAAPPSPAQPAPAQPLPAQPAMPVQPAEKRILNLNAAFAVPGQFIVRFQPNASTDAKAAVKQRVTNKDINGRILFTSSNGSSFGFAVPAQIDVAQKRRIVSDDVIKAILALFDDPIVASIRAAQKATDDTVQYGPPTGLDRIDQPLLGVRPAPPLDSMYTYPQTGNGVDVYVIDSGIWQTHGDFGNRVILDYTEQCNISTSCSGLDYFDCNGHGTAVAGIIGGTIFGVAKNVQLHSIRAHYLQMDFDENGKQTPFCSATEPSLIAAVQFVTGLHIASPMTPAVVNMSQQVVGPPTGELDDEIGISIAAGVTYVLAATNVGNACDYSPGRAGGVDAGGAKKPAITVGTMDPTADSTPGYSFGKCIDLFAPGERIVSARPPNLRKAGCFPVWDVPTYEAQICGGTSMAAPHVAGCAALYLQKHIGDVPLPTPAQVWAGLRATADAYPTTQNWPGILDAMTGMPVADSPDVLLQCGN